MDVEQRVRVVDSTVATWPARLLPQMKGADRQLRRIGEAVIQSRKLARPESTGPICLFQLASQARLTLGDANKEG